MDEGFFGGPPEFWPAGMDLTRRVFLSLQQPGAGPIPDQANRERAFRNSAFAPDPEMEIFSRCLDHVTASFPVTPHDRPFHLASIACGDSKETAVLCERFMHPVGRFCFTGLDIRHGMIERARNRWLETLRSATGKAEPPRHLSVVFRAEDLSAPTAFSPERNFPVDLLFIRHQNVWNGVEKWLRMLEQAVAILRPGSPIVITSYFDQEHELAEAVFARVGYRRDFTYRNPKSLPLPTPGKSIDRHWAVYLPGTSLL